MIEARCKRCLGTFVPEGEDDLIHGLDDNEEPCGGQGAIVGEWKAGAVISEWTPGTLRVIDTSPQTLVLFTLSTAHFEFEGLAQDRAHAEYMVTQAWSAHRLDYPDADFDPNMDDVNFNEIKIGDVLRDGEELVATGPAR